MYINSGILLLTLYISNLFSCPLFADKLEQENTYQRCLAETHKYVFFDPIPQNVSIGESFTLKASIPETVKKEFSENDQLIIGIVPTADPEEFSYIGSPIDPFEIISKEGGRWEWKFKAKAAGKALLIDFRVGILKNNNVVSDNCTIPISIDIKSKPIYIIIWQFILKYIIWPLVTLFGWLFATIPTLRNLLDSFAAKLLKYKRK